MEQEALILVVSEHQTFGWKFCIHSAGRTEDEGWRLLGVPNLKQEQERGRPPEQTALISLLEDVSDQALMKAYSRQKSTLAFLKEVSREVSERFIRPRIELANRRVAEAALKTDIPIYWRRDISFKILYETHRIRLVPTPAECLFHFVKDAENGLRYFIALSCEGEEISLRKKPGIILSEKPCLVLTGKDIRGVEQIEAKKLTPFFEKTHIAVPAQTEEVYLRNFVFKTMQTYEVRIQGIPVWEIQPEKKAFLSLERDFHQRLVLILSFQYEQAPRIYPGSSKKKTIELETTGGATAIRWYKRDFDWESRLMDYLQQEGLRLKAPNHFYPASDESAQEKETPFQLIEWLNQRESGSLREFIIEYHLERSYFIEPVALRPDFEAKIDWFELNIEVLIGDYTLPFAYFRNHILAHNNEYLLPDGTTFILPEEWFAKYYDLLLYSELKDGSLRLKKIHAPLLDHAMGKQVGGKKQKIIRDILQIPMVHPPLPPQPAALLREYQKEGFYWLEHLYKNGFGGCLADDMGLGKTLQAITLLQHIYAGENRLTLPATLVVVPTSLLHNWKNELARFAPDLRVSVYSKDARVFHLNQVVLTSYGMIRRDIKYFCEYTFQLIILDESQYIKNPASQTYRAMLQLSSPHKFVMTGTPLENSLDDLWAQFNFVNEGLLNDDLPAFRQDFIQPIRERNKAQEELLKRLIRPFLLRRTKEEVAPELPALLQEIVFCDMSEAQQSLYETEKNRIRNTILEAKENPDLPHNNFIALQGLSKLRQLANHPKLLDPDYANDSGKFEQILLSFETLKASGHKVLIFSSFVKYLNLLAAKFDKEGWKYAMLTGETSRREEEIRRFIDNDDIHAFFISLKAGGTGLNLTAADYVFILDPWWNPASEMQALSRAHRIGQEKKVIACRFISTETVEEKILRLQESKTALYEAFINANNPLSLFTRAEIEELFI
ncbi:MAG: DEAD/DEAH box helicase [Tannerellaceae bacterium]|jgi:superfamily II DNA or RNA helicase|nr:DEAD/DEAH box helicase [Tannerellaceae bacterium]